MPKTHERAAADARDQLELLKAVAQAWHSQTGNPTPTDEYAEAQKINRLGFKPRPSRFKVEASTSAASRRDQPASSNSGTSWNFSESLLDSYEIVTLAKKLEASLALDHPMPTSELNGERSRAESKNSLRNLFYRASSRKFTAAAAAAAAAAAVSRDQEGG